ncbi:hypothetical protein ACNJYD_16785 [Bradyrhizobium sp. DASA03005]|uniref:hypothetical protein n=1 Tax=Bradyrhizobium TaxID=374 RepID=UPI00155EA9CC|nr:MULTISPECIES: hypothetical protein [Bradyrhizobium]MBR1166905.1 hypothetical protein [Bradyrhizobium liaoningense]MDD1516704.1 hypothetical protein [Bradyrhizobium sp. WBAH30]MDD1542910.1 hypothetical protein [Bradyrhizobium sp. WBAH41]MDD1554607.1 hypothetical protein [Bradyrhizobium sp. WBAH23]MDD1562558.1 hypothetical protein [Bradyrhizobium sp. WBAH33]
MTKAARIFASISSPRVFTERPAVPAKRSDTAEFVAIALFSGIGLFVSLVAVILGMQGVWS